MTKKKLRNCLGLRCDEEVEFPERFCLKCKKKLKNNNHGKTGRNPGNRSSRGKDIGNF